MSNLTIKLLFFGLGTVAALLGVGLAIWAAFLSRRLMTLSATERLIETPRWRGRLRSCSMSILAIQATLVLAMRYLAALVPGLPWTEVLIGFVLVIGLQMQAQYAVERQLGDREGRQGPVWEGMALNLRVLGVMLAGQLLFAGIYLVLALVAVGFGMLLRLPGREIAILAWALIPIVALAGLYVLYAAAPLFIRATVPCRPVIDPSLRQRVEMLFQRVGLAVPSLWIIDTPSLREHNAMVAGFKNGHRWFQPALFFTAELPELLAPEELEAVLLHEVSHIHLRHLQKRLVGAIGSFLVILILAAAVGVLAAHLWHWQLFVFPVLGFALGVSLPSWLGNRQARRQELEADAHAVLELGADFDAFASALRKLAPPSDTKMVPRGNVLSATHPAVEERIEILAARVHTYPERRAS